MKILRGGIGDGVRLTSWGVNTAGGSYLVKDPSERYGGETPPMHPKLVLTLQRSRQQTKDIKMFLISAISDCCGASGGCTPISSRVDKSPNKGKAPRKLDKELKI